MSGVVYLVVWNTVDSYSRILKWTSGDLSFIIIWHWHKFWWCLRGCLLCTVTQNTVPSAWHSNGISSTSCACACSTISNSRYKPGECRCNICRLILTLMIKISRSNKLHYSAFRSLILWCCLACKNTAPAIFMVFDISWKSLAVHDMENDCCNSCVYVSCTHV